MNNFVITIILAFFITSCGTAPASDVDLPAIAQKLDELGAKNEFSGNFLIADADTILLSTSYGLANIERNEPVTMNTRFNLASMNKMFTAATIMRLLNAGKLGLEDEVGVFLPNYPNELVRDEVTIEQLLTHTSGMGDMFTPAFEQADPNGIRGLDDYLDKFAADSLRFAPGSDFGYSNAGYIVLGLIIEAITEEDYYDYVRNDLLLPLGMDNTGWYHGDSLYQTVATAYGEQDSLGVWKENPYLVMKGSSAGGGYSTVPDLLKYGRALAAGKVVPLSVLAEMREDRFDHGYGYGLSLRTLNEKIVYGHNGGFPGVSGELDIFPESGLFVVSLSNRGPRDGWASCRSIVRNAIVGETEGAVGVLNADRLVEVYEQEGLEAAIAAIEDIGDPITTNQLISASERYDNSGQRAKAIDMLSICIKVDPENWFPVSIKADLQLLEGDTSQAIVNWKKSLELNPDNQWAKDQLANMTSSGR